MEAVSAAVEEPAATEEAEDAEAAAAAGAEGAEEAEDPLRERTGDVVDPRCSEMDLSLDPSVNAASNTSCGRI